jgi:hypothetical protein
MLSKTIFFAMLVCGPSVSGQSFSSMKKLSSNVLLFNLL